MIEKRLPEAGWIFPASVFFNLPEIQIQDIYSGNDRYRPENQAGNNRRAQDSENNRSVKEKYLI